MADIQASVKYSDSLSQSQTRAHNEDFVYGSQNYAFSRKPDYWIYIYNISGQEHIVSRPPIVKEMKIRAALPSEKYAYVGKFPQPLNLPKGNVDSGTVDYVVEDTRRFVTDIICPDNLGITQDVIIENSTSGGSNDLGAKGVFWSYNGPGASENGRLEEPTEAEIMAARKRMEVRYKDLLKKARAVEVSNPTKLDEYLSPEHHAAAEYFGETFSWHSKQVKADYCDQCGESIRAGAAFHQTSDGGLCIRDWDRAIKAGRVTRAMAFEATGDDKYAPKTPQHPAKG